MVGVDHPDVMVVLLCQQGGVMLPQVVAVDKVDAPLLAEGGQLPGGPEIKAAAHLHPAAGDAQRLQPLHQQTAFVISEIRLHTGVVQVADQRFHIPLRTCFSGMIQ